MKRVLLTGCSGFIGAQTAHQLISQGVEVIGVDNMNDYYDIRLKEMRLQELMTKKGFSFYQIDIEDMEKLSKLFDRYQFDAVLNLAARAGVRYSMIDPHVYMSTNAHATLNILELMRKYNVWKMVLASTSSLYAGQSMPFTEGLAVNSPISPYAASKKAAEMICHSYHYLYDLDISVVRYFTVFGPAGRPDMSIFRFIKWVDEETPIELFGDGTQSRDFTYIDDIARGTILAAQKKLGFEVINLGGGKNPISINTVIAWIEEMLGKKARIDYKPFHKADIKETWADISKAKRLLNWEPSIDVKEGVQKSVDWYLKHKNTLRHITL